MDQLGNEINSGDKNSPDISTDMFSISLTAYYSHLSRVVGCQNSKTIFEIHFNAAFVLSSLEKNQLFITYLILILRKGRDQIKISDYPEKTVKCMDRLNESLDVLCEEFSLKHAIEHFESISAYRQIWNGMAIDYFQGSGIFWKHSSN